MHPLVINFNKNGLGIGTSNHLSQHWWWFNLFGKFDGTSDQVHGATIDAHKRNGTDGNYGFNMIGRTREHGNATMQTGFVFGYDRVELYTE